jgi:hypothetical protein
MTSVMRRSLGLRAVVFLVVLSSACGDDEAGPTVRLDAAADAMAAADGGVDATAGDAPSAEAAAVSDAVPGDGATAGGATVMGTLTLPGTAVNKPFAVRILNMPGLTYVAQSTGLTTGNTMLPYVIPNVPAGTYYVLAFVDVDSSGGDSSTPGDYVGWYGHSGDGNPPPGGKNAAVPASGSVTFDFSLVIR